MMIFKSFYLSFFIFLIINNVRTEEDFCSINFKKVVNKVSDKFLSFSIDPVVLLSGFNLSESSQQLAKRLAPTYVRLAGPSTKFVKYIDNEYGTAENNDTSKIMVTPSMWFGVNEWLYQANITPVFGINDLETDMGEWNPQSTLPLLELSDKFNVSCYWQLGFDCSNKNETQYKEDLTKLRNVLNTFPDKAKTWKIVASDFSKCHSLEYLENVRKVIQEIENRADVVVLEPNDKTGLYVKKDLLPKLIHSTNSNLLMWKTIQKDSKPVSFSSAISWCQQLGDAAKLGYDVILRQPRYNELFSITPVYWVSILYKTLMGRVVLDTRKPFSSSKSYVYAQCSKKQNDFLRRGAVTIMIVNNETESYTTSFRLGNPYIKSVEIQTYILTSTSEDSIDIFLNGVKLEEDFLKDEKLTFPSKHRRANALKPISLEVPSKSIGFFVLPSARASACIQYEGVEDQLIKEIDEDQQISLSREIVEAVEPRGMFNSLKEIQEMLEKELQSDETYYKSNRQNKVDFNILKSRLLKPLNHKLTENNFGTNNLILDKLRKPKQSEIDSRLDKLLEEVNSLKQSLGNDVPVFKPKPKLHNLSSSEMSRVMKNRARLMAARKNIVFTSKELDELVSRGQKKHSRMYRSVADQWEDLKWKLEEKRDEFLSKTNDLKAKWEQNKNVMLKKDFNSKFESFKNKYNKKPSIPSLSNLRSKLQAPLRFRRTVDVEPWNSWKDKLQQKKNEFLGSLNINDLVSNFDRQREQVQAKLDMEKVQSKFEDAKNKILGAMNLNDLKSRIQDAHDKFLQSFDIGDVQSKLEEAKNNLLRSSNLDDIKERFNDVISKWDEQKNALYNRRSKRSATKLGSIRSKLAHKRQISALLKSRMKEMNKQGNLRRNRRDINMNLLNLKSRTDSTGLPTTPKHLSNLPSFKKPLDLSERSSEEFMSSSDEINLDSDESKPPIPKKKIDIFNLPRLKPMHLPVSPKSRINHEKEQHPCEEEIFGKGIISGSPDEQWAHFKKLDDCFHMFNEKKSSDGFTKKLSDYLKDPVATQKSDEIDLSLDDGMDFDFKRKRRDAEVTHGGKGFTKKLSDNLKDHVEVQESDELELSLSLDDDDMDFDLERKRRDAEVTHDDVEKYKKMLHKKIADLEKVIKQDRKKIVEDKLRMQKERVKALKDKSLKKVQPENIVTSEISTNATSDESKINKLNILKEKLRQAKVESAKNTDALKKKRKEELDKIVTQLNKSKGIVSRLSAAALDIGQSSKPVEKPNILGDIEDKRKQLLIKSEMKEIEMLKKRLERRKKILDRLINEGVYNEKNVEESTSTPPSLLNDVIDKKVEPEKIEEHNNVDIFHQNMFKIKTEPKLAKEEPTKFATHNNKSNIIHFVDGNGNSTEKSLEGTLGLPLELGESGKTEKSNDSTIENVTENELIEEMNTQKPGTTSQNTVDDTLSAPEHIQVTDKITEVTDKSVIESQLNSSPRNVNTDETLNIKKEENLNGNQEGMNLSENEIDDTLSAPPTDVFDGVHVTENIPKLEGNDQSKSNSEHSSNDAKIYFVDSEEQLQSTKKDLIIDDSIHNKLQENNPQIQTKESDKIEQTTVSHDITESSTEPNLGSTVDDNKHETTLQLVNNGQFTEDKIKIKTHTKNRSLVNQLEELERKLEEKMAQTVKENVDKSNNETESSKTHVSQAESNIVKMLVDNLEATDETQETKATEVVSTTENQLQTVQEEGQEKTTVPNTVEVASHLDPLQTLAEGMLEAATDNVQEGSQSSTTESLDDIKPEKRKRSVSAFGKTFGDYQPRTVNLRKWKPEDILSLKRVSMVSRNGFRPSGDNNIYRSFLDTKMGNTHFKNKRSTDIDLMSVEKDVDSAMNDIDADYQFNNRIAQHSSAESNDDILKMEERKAHYGDSYDGEDLNGITKESVVESETIMDDKKEPLVSYDDKMTFGSKQKKPIKPQSYDYIQKILPRDEQHAITKLFSNLNGLLQSIGKKFETSFKSIFL